MKAVLIIFLFKYLKFLEMPLFFFSPKINGLIMSRWDGKSWHILFRLCTYPNWCTRKFTPEQFPEFNHGCGQAEYLGGSSLSPYKGQTAKRFLFPLATGLLTLELKINQHDDCVKSWAVKNSARKASIQSWEIHKAWGTLGSKPAGFIEVQWGHISLVSTILVYIKLYFKSDDYIGWVSVPVPKMPNKYQILSRASCHPYPLHLNHANYTKLTLECLWLGENDVFPILGAFFILFIWIQTC